MDIGVTQWTLDSSGVDAVYRAGQLGFSSIQLDYGGYDGLSELSEPDVKKAYQDASKEAGVEIVGVGCNVFNTVSLIDPQADITGLIENIMGGVRGVASLLYVPSFNASEIKTEDDMRNTAHWLKLVCDMADAHMGGRLTLTEQM